MLVTQLHAPNQAPGAGLRPMRSAAEVPVGVREWNTLTGLLDRRRRR